MYVKVEGNQFVKNTDNTALLTVNRAAISENEARKMLAKKLNGKNDEINTLKAKVEDLSTDISEIKFLLKQIKITHRDIKCRFLLLPEQTPSMSGECKLISQQLI